MQLRAVATIPEEDPADDRVRRARAGDLGAFEELYRSHVAGVYGLCLRMTADPARAEDVTQDTFIRAWKKLGSLRGDGGFAAWVRRVAINVVLSDGRSRRRRQDRERPLGEPEVTVGTTPAPSPGSALDLERAIGRLPSGAREVFVLHDVEGYRHTEIGEMLDVAAGTSKAQLHRARRLLREALRG